MTNSVVGQEKNRFFFSVLWLLYPGHLEPRKPNSISRKLLSVTYAKLDFYDILTSAHY